MGIVFVAGVHGVGKTTACVHVANSLGLAHYSASEIIKSEKASAIAMGSKAVADIDGNQLLLIQGVQKLCELHDEPIILDGHFSLLKVDGGIETVSIDVFRALLLKGIVVYQDEPKLISDRLKDRDKTVSDPFVVDQRQRVELQHGNFVATDLNIPIQILKAFDMDGLVRLVSKQMLGIRR